MARIPDSELERLKKEIPVERLVLGFGLWSAIIPSSCRINDLQAPIRGRYTHPPTLNPPYAASFSSPYS
jgi:hypothetical protein